MCIRDRVNGMQDRMFKVKTYAQDALSAEKRSQFQEMVEGDMLAKPILSQMTQDFGIDVFNVPEEELPETGEELELFMNLKYKPAIEIACEEENRYEFIVMSYPLFVIGGTGSPVNPIALF